MLPFFFVSFSPLELWMNEPSSEKTHVRMKMEQGKLRGCLLAANYCIVLFSSTKSLTSDQELVAVHVEHLVDMNP